MKHAYWAEPGYSSWVLLPHLAVDGMCGVWNQDWDSLQKLIDCCPDAIANVMTTDLRADCTMCVCEAPMMVHSCRSPRTGRSDVTTILVGAKGRGRGQNGLTYSDMISCCDMCTSHGASNLLPLECMQPW